MARFFVAFLFLAGLSVRASELISVSKGISATVRQPHVTAELISETAHEGLGSFLVALHLHMDAGWHTYCINPGDAGLATTIKWTLPPGWSAGPIQWPTPEVHAMGPETTYGYAGDVYLLTTLTAQRMSQDPLVVPVIKARADWLVCEEECIPGKADLQIALLPPEGAGPDPADVAHKKIFEEAKARLPVANTRWSVTATQTAAAIRLQFTDLTGSSPKIGSGLYFFPEQPNVLSPKEDPKQIEWNHPGGGFTWPLALQQNGEKTDHLSGVLISDQPLQTGGAKAIYLASVPVKDSAAAASSPTGASPQAATPPAPWAATSDGPPLQPETQPRLLAVLGAAFLGGLILNLMPCVLPVLSLKIFSLTKHAGDDPRGAWKQGVAFTAGVVVSFWILAGLLLALRAAGNHLGWGFQMQSPGFVLALIFLFFLLGLNLFGVFELGTSLVGLDAKATGKIHRGFPSSFLNGALATLAATPCTAPYMGASVGFAAEQPAWVAMLIFTVLALGMATPYLLLTAFPGALRFLPKPGAWMEAFKQFMGFLLMATVIFLLYVFGALVGEDQVPWLLAALLVAGVGAWIYGKWGTPVHSGGVRAVAYLLTFAALGYAIWWGADLAGATPPTTSGLATDSKDQLWQTWSVPAVNAARAQGVPVFVDFTAAWCLSCKVNEHVALETDAVRAVFAQKKVARFRADWTHADPAITEVLQSYHRDGVPLYLYYPAGTDSAPQVLPEVLTPGIVEEALGADPSTQR